MSARERLAALDDLPATELCTSAEAALSALVTVMNEETTLLRAGRYRDASALTADKIRLAQDYVGLARSVQRQIDRLKLEAPADLDRLFAGHDMLTTQMADNLRTIATARTVTEDLLTGVALVVGEATRPKTYGITGEVRTDPRVSAKGISINRAL